MNTAAQYVPILIIRQDISIAKLLRVDNINNVRPKQ